jgi:endonuclease/exonuclease/phosphatase family metal-dependent hydrolase
MPAASTGASSTLRVATLNLWGEQGPHERRLALAAAGFAGITPDVVALQEVRAIEGRLPNQAATLAQRLGLDYVFCPATPWGGGQEGVALLARTILTADSTELPGATDTERRVVLMVTCETAAGPVNVYTTHLNYRLHDGLTRERQVLAIDDFIRAHPSDRPQILMGDFNATPAHDEIRFLRGQTTLAGRRTYYQDAFARLHPHDPGTTWAVRNPYTDRLHWLEPDRRLDYVFVTPERSDGRGLIHLCRIVLDQPDADGVFPSDHFGVMADVQLTPRATP